MRKKQKRRGTLSVSAKMYERILAAAKARGVPVSQLIEKLLRDLPNVEGA